jgi:hypothetical protein
LWLSRSIVILLALQVGLLWTHGSLLQRQHDDIQALREDVQALADSLDQDQDDWDSNEADTRPARWVRHRGGRPVRAAYLRAEEAGKAPADEGDPALTDLQKDTGRVRQSEQEALAKARDAQEKLSIEANIRKAEAQARLQAEADGWKRWVWGAAAVGILALGARALYRRRG